MPKIEVTWQQKAARLAGGPGKGASTRLAKRIGESPNSVYNWLTFGMEPRNVRAILPVIAAKYRVTVEWLTNGKDEPPPLIGKDASDTFIAAVQAAEMPEHYKRVMLAMSDPRVAAFLAEQLRVYEATVAPRRTA